MENQRSSGELSTDQGTVTARETVLVNDLDVTDNGDGTLAILVMGTGNFTVFGEDGNGIAGNPRHPGSRS